MNAHKADASLRMDDLRKIISCRAWKPEKAICRLGRGAKRITCKHLKSFSE